MPKVIFLILALCMGMTVLFSPVPATAIAPPGWNKSDKPDSAPGHSEETEENAVRSEPGGKSSAPAPADIPIVREGDKSGGETGEGVLIIHQ